MAPYARAFVVLLLALPIHAAGAQGLLDFLFGADGPAPSRTSQGYARPAPGFSPYGELSNLGDLFEAPSYDYASRSQATYRTLCVRMCDGFYFPVSHATSSINFSRDAETCEASCGREARLFYYPNPGGNIEGMLDLTGRAYASYPTAFKYRKALVQGCQCRPQPWTEAARARHRSYAAMQPPLPASTSELPSIPPAVVASERQHAVARPDPIQWHGYARPPGQSFYDWPGSR